MGVFFTATRPTNVQINVKIKEQVLVFDANGGSGSMATQSFDSGVAKALAANGFTKAGYVFAGWNTAADGSGTAYGDGQEVGFSPAGDGDLLTLYAQWKEPVAAQDNMVTIGQTEFTYNGGEQKPALSVEYEGAALTEGTDYTVTWPTDGTNAGYERKHRTACNHGIRAGGCKGACFEHRRGRYDQGCLRPAGKKHGCFRVCRRSGAALGAGSELVDR